MSDALESFRSTLEEHHEWPCEYTFKFIVPSKSLGELKSLLDNIAHSEKESKTGKYTSVTATATADSANFVMNIYHKAATIEGCISL
ncbi:MAG: hypothetical protein BA863_04550 [Desulfovibrio sp. S3730MH75]|nr:MAG: hypothetical protein BA863_04550 [Desulfovibrio sp. S3730MH75]